MLILWLAGLTFAFGAAVFVTGRALAGALIMSACIATIFLTLMLIAAGVGRH